MLVVAAACAWTAARAGPDRVEAVRRQQRLRVRAPDGGAGPQRGDAGHDHAGDAPPSRAGRRSARSGDRPRGRPRPGGDPVRRTVRAPARPDRGHARPDRVRPARHRPVAPAVLPSLRTRARAARPAAQLAECAAQIGPTRSDYTTAQTVADIEAIRQAGGYEKLVLYGTSYGTKVAERYAQTYPDRVSALVLDSVVPPNGPEPLDLPTFAAIPRVLGELCAHGACARITRNPVADVAKLVRRIGGGAMSGRWIDADRSAPHAWRLLRGAARHADRRRSRTGAARGIPGGGAFRRERATGRRLRACCATPSNGAAAPKKKARARASTRRCTSPRAAKRSCSRGAAASSPRKRLAEANAAIGGLPASRFAPFARGDVLGVSDIPECASWPYTSPAPGPVPAPLPSVPTLILSGAEDLRTPTANAREVAAQIPGSHLLVVPEVGHSVLGSDFSGCANKALQALFKPAPIKPCTGGAQLLNLLDWRRWRRPACRTWRPRTATAGGRAARCGRSG